MRVPLAASIAALLAAVAVAAPRAEAATLCVNTTGPQCDQAFTAAQLQSAVATANADQSSLDRIEIGPGVYPVAPINASSRIEIVGAGRDQTVITNGAPMGFSGIVLLANFDTRRVSDLTIRIGAGGLDSRGLQVAGTGIVVERVRIEATPDATPSTGLDLSSVGTVRRAEVQLGSGVGASLSGPTVEDSTFEAPTGLFLQSGTARRITATGATAMSLGSGDVLVENSVLRGRSAGLALSQHTSGTVSVSHTTVAGTDEPGSVGIRAEKGPGAFAALTSRLTIRNTAVSGFAVDLAHRGHAGAGTSGCGTNCQITQITDVHHSALGVSARVADGGGPGSLTLGPGNVDLGDPRFVDRDGGDLRPRHDSPLIDAGDPAALGAGPLYTGESPTDVAGALRIVDGRPGGDPAARRDIGAHEYARATPSVSLALPAGPPFLYRPFPLAATATDPDPLDPVMLAFSVGGRDLGAATSTRFTTLGPSRVRVTATDPTGLTAVAEQTVTVRARPGRCANLRTGTAGRDRFPGTAAGDRLRGGRGADVLGGGRGADCLHGGAGADVLRGGPGADLLDGGPAADLLVGGRGRDRVPAGPGDDRILARDGERDVVLCASGDDVAVVDRIDVVRGCERTLRPPRRR